MTQDKAMNLLTNTVYEALFGLSRDELLKQAKQHKNYGAAAGILYPSSDEDESMRDCMSLEALQCLNEAETLLRPMVLNFQIVSSNSTEAAVKLLNEEIRRKCDGIRAKHGHFSIWYEGDN